MPTINQLPSASTLSNSDQLPVYSSSNGDARKASLSALLAWFRSTFASPDFETVLEAPTGSGFNIQLAASTESLWLIANPTGAFAAGTITLPPVADCFDGQQIIVTCSQAVTALTIDGNGATVLGEPSSLGTGGFFSLRFRESQSTWYTTSQSLGSLDTINDLTLTGSILDAQGETMLSFVQSDVGTAVNNLSVVYGITGDPVGLIAEGADTNISINLSPKGTGVVNVSSSLSVNAEVIANSASIDEINVGVSLNYAPVAFAGLPSGFAGLKAFVTDATATMAAGIGTIVSGGGANIVPVYHDGTDWRIG